MKNKLFPFIAGTMLSAAPVAAQVTDTIVFSATETDTTIITQDENGVHEKSIIRVGGGGPIELWILNGEVVDQEPDYNVGPNEKLSVVTAYGEDLVKKYGPKAKNGVKFIEMGENAKSMESIWIVNGERLLTPPEAGNPDDKVMKMLLDGENYEVTTYGLHSEEAIRLYGEDAKWGATVITTKK